MQSYLLGELDKRMTYLKLYVEKKLVLALENVFPFTNIFRQNNSKLKDYDD